MDTIFLEQLKVQARLGVPNWERVLPQTIMLDIEITYDLSKACYSDNIDDTIDYGKVVARIKETVEQREFNLAESLAEHICQLILQEFKAISVRLKLSKPSILPGLTALGVVLVRPY